MDEDEEVIAEMVALAASLRADAVQQERRRLLEPTPTDEEIVDAVARFGIIMSKIVDLCDADGADTVNGMREGPAKLEAMRLIRVEAAIDTPRGPRPDLVRRIEERQQELRKADWQP